MKNNNPYKDLQNFNPPTVSVRDLIKQDKKEIKAAQLKEFSNGFMEANAKYNNVKVTILA